MRDRECHEHPACPVAAATRLLGDRWTFLLLRDLSKGARRFKDLQETCDGISPSMLAARLRELQEHGVVTRTSYHEIPPRVEYELTEKGRDALPVIRALATFARRWMLPSESAHPVGAARDAANAGAGSG